MGAEIEYKPITEKDKSKLHKLGKKMMRGIFLGYVQQHGGGWSGDLYVVDWDDMQNADSFHEVEEKIKRFKAQEVEIIKIQGNFSFPLAQGNLSQPLSEKRVVPRRRERSPRASNPGGEEEANSDGEPPAEIDYVQGEPQELGDPEPVGRPDFWTVTDDVIVRWHRTPRLKLFLPNVYCQYFVS